MTYFRIIFAQQKLGWSLCKYTNTQIQNIEYTNTQQSWDGEAGQFAKNELSPVIE